MLTEATQAHAAAVVLDIDTFGGRVDAAVLIRDALLRAKVKTVAFVNRRAISAGALICLAAETIVMAGGGTIGAATPVQIGLPGGPAQPVEEKTVSYMRKEFRATAESRKRPPLLAEAMVDADVEIPGVIEKGETPDADDRRSVAAQAGGCARRDAGCAADGLESSGRRSPSDVGDLGRITRARPDASDREFAPHGAGRAGTDRGDPNARLWRARRFRRGLSGAVSVGALAGSACGLGRTVADRRGLLLLAIEMFVTPGFGILGALGIAALLGGLGLSLVGTGATWEVVLAALGQVLGALLLAIVAALALLRAVPRLPFGRRLVLETGLQAEAGYASAPEADRRWLGKRGVAASTLRPAGIAHFDHERVDVVADGEYIEPGDPIEVLRVEGNRIVVRRIEQDRERSES